MSANLNVKNLQTHIVVNQEVIAFLYRCLERTNNSFKKKAYERAINEVYSYWHEINRYNWKPQHIGQSISRKILEFLEGFPEEDILNS